MANEQNLRPCEHKFTQEEAKKGARASAESKRRRKAMREVIDELLSREYTDKTGTQVDGVTALMTKVYQQAIGGDMKAVQFLRDTVGEMPVQKVETVEIPHEAYERVREALEMD